MSGNNFVCIAVEEKEERRILTSENEACVLQNQVSDRDKSFFRSYFPLLIESSS